MAKDIRSDYRVYWPPAPGPYTCSLDYSREPRPAWAMKFYDCGAKETSRHIWQTQPRDGVTSDELREWVGSLIEPTVAHEVVAKMAARHPELFVPHVRHLDGFKDSFDTREIHYGRTMRSGPDDLARSAVVLRAEQHEPR